MKGAGLVLGARLRMRSARAAAPAVVVFFAKSAKRFATGKSRGKASR